MALRFRTRADRSQPQQRAASTEPLILTERHPDNSMSGMERAAVAAGRIMFGGYFVYSGVRHFREREMFIGYAKSKGVTSPQLALLGSGAMLIVGGLSLLTGVKPRFGAALVTGFLAG